MSRTGIITSYLSLRLVVIRRFIDIYPDETVPTDLQKLVSDHPTNQALAEFPTHRWSVMQGPVFTLLWR